MTIAAVSMVKDEEDVVEATVRNMRDQVDLVLVADNVSTDRTRSILDDLAGELDGIVVVDDPDPAYYQAEKMTRLIGSLPEHVDVEDLWVVPFDADELWRNVHALPLLDDDVRAVSVPGFDHRPTGVDDPAEEDPTRRLEYRERDGATFRAKVAFRWLPGATIAQGNHTVHRPIGDGKHRKIDTLDPGEHAVRIAHYPIRSLEQFIRKGRNGAAAYQATNLPPGWGAHWRSWGDLTDEGMANLYRDRFYVEDPDATARLVHDPVHR